jgi:hypothetical protein
MMQAPSSHIRLLGAFFVFQELFFAVCLLVLL